MIKHKTLARESLHKFGGDGKVFRVNQDVVSQIEFFQRGNAAKKIWLQQESIVGFTLHDVANADELWVLSQDLQLRSNVRGTQIDPANYAENPRRTLSQLEKPARFFQRLPRLHRNRSVEAASFQFEL